MPRSFWIVVAVYGVLISAIYYDVMKWLVEKDWTRADYSHCYIIPLAVVYLIWEKRRALASIPSIPSSWGLAPIVLAMAFFWLGELAGEFFVMYFSLWLCVVGLCWIHLGWQKLKIIAFPLVLLLASFPLPHFVNNQVTLRLKLISSQLGVELLQLWGMSAYREGNVIDIGYSQLQVVDACSGLRYLIPLMVLGLIMAHWLKAPMGRRVLLFVSTVPLAVGVNALRIAATGVLYNSWGAEVAEEFFHGFSGWLIFMLTTVVLWAEMLLLRRYPTRLDAMASPKSRDHAAPGAPAEKAPAGRTGDRERTLSIPRASVAAALILLATLTISQGVEFREKIPVKKPFELFPAGVGEWTGLRQEMEPEVVRELDVTGYILMDYADESGRVVNFYTAYYETQRKGESIHSPSTCMPGDGWIFSESGATQLQLDEPGGGTMGVKRALMEKDGQKQIVYYWFPMRGRILTEPHEIKLFTFWDALTRQRTDGALVRLVTPVYRDENPEQSEARLQAFAGKIVPILNGYLPGD